MVKEYQRHIVSTPEHQVWLHRTHVSDIESILKNGLYYATNLSSRASLQPVDLEKAESLYRQTHKGSNAVVVIKIPRQIVERYYPASGSLKGKRHEGYEGDRNVSYFNGGFWIQRQHIHGWIDRETNEYHENPYLNEPQRLTAKHFPAAIYGGLEKDVTEKKPKIKADAKKPNRRSIRKMFGMPPSPKDYPTLP